MRVAIFETIAARPTATREDRHFLAIAQDNLAEHLVKLDRLKDAAPYFQKSLAVFESLVAESPNDIEIQSHIGQTLAQRASLLVQTGNVAEAKTILENAVAHDRLALKLSKNRDDLRTLLGAHLIALSNVKLKRGAFREAAADALELPRTVLARDRAHGCLDAARILAQVVAQADADAKLSDSERTQLTRNYLSRTMVLLSEAVDASPKLAGQVKNDPHINALKSRPEIKTILDALEGANR